MEQDVTFEHWLDRLLPALNGFDFNAKHLNRLLDEKPLGTLLWHSAVLSNLAGRDSLIEEHQDSIILQWLRLPFLEAIALLRNKIVIPVDSYYGMEEGYHSWAFSVAKIAKLDLLNKIKRSLLRAQDQGTPFEDWKAEFEKNYKQEYGNTPTARRSYTIFDTNLRSAHGTGRGQQMKELSDRKPGEYVGVWRWRDSPNPRLNHQGLHNKAIPYSHKFWEKCATPAGFGCRCSVSLMRRTIAENLGIEILEGGSIPNPEDIAEEGFRYPQWGIPKTEAFKKEKKKEWSEDIADLAD